MKTHNAMVAILICLLAFFLGIGAAHLSHRHTNDEGNGSLICLARSQLITSNIEALGLLNQGDVESARLILASSINAQIAITKKSKTLLSAESDQVKEWEKQMAPYNREIGLK